MRIKTYNGYHLIYMVDDDGKVECFWSIEHPTKPKRQLLKEFKQRLRIEPIKTYPKQTRKKLKGGVK